MNKLNLSCSSLRRNVYQLPYKKGHRMYRSSARNSYPLKIKQLRIWTDRVNVKDWPQLLKNIAEDRSLAKLIVYSRRNRGCGCGKKIREKRSAEEKMDKFRNFLPRFLVEAISSCAKNSSAITSVTVDGIPLASRYLNTLCEGLKYADNLSHLSLARCRIGDGGCALVLNALTDNGKLCILDLTSCRLTDWSASSLSVFLKKKNKEKEKENSSLLHGEWVDRNKSNVTLGFHTLVLNHNPKLSDRGARVLIDVLKDDFRVKTLNLRDCGLTLRSGETVIKLLKINSVLMEMDLKENEIPETMLHNVARILQGRLRKVERSFEPISKKRLLNNPKQKRSCIKSDKSQRRGSYPVNNNNNNCKIVTTRQKSCLRVKTAHRSKSQGSKLNLTKLSRRLSRLISSNAVLFRELISDQELLTEVRTRRLDMEREFSELEPRVEELRNGIYEQDAFCARISEEEKLLKYLKKLLTRLELLPVGSLGPNPAWEIISETDLSISAPATGLNTSEDRNTRRRIDGPTQRGRPHCPRKLQSGK